MNTPHDKHDKHDLHADDARLTAYALGELDAAQTAEVEALLAASPDARRAVDEIRGLTGLLAESLAAEPAAELTDAQRAAVLAGHAGRAAPPANSSGSARLSWVRNLVPLAAAATVLLAAAWMLVRDDDLGRMGPADEAPMARLNKDMTGAVRKAGEPAGVLDGLASRTRAKDDLTDRMVSLGYVEVEAAAAGNAQALADAPADAYRSLWKGRVDGSVATPAEGEPPELDAETIEQLQALGYIGGDNGIGEGEALNLVVPAVVVHELAREAPVSTPEVNAVIGGGDGNFGKVGKRQAATPTTPSTTSGSLGVLTGRGHKAGAAMPAPPEETVKAVVVKAGGASKYDNFNNALGVDRDDARTQHYQAQGQEGYAGMADNPFKLPQGEDALSTFSIDVDTGSYANVRRFLNEGRLPPAEAVRIEELINYFDYADAAPRDAEVPFAVHVETAPAPWAPDHRLVRIGLKGYEVPSAERPAANLVFLLDVSGSMNNTDKLPLLKSSMRLMVHALEARDRVAIVTYAGSSGLVLDSTSCDNKGEILAALDRLQAGGSTNGGAGIELAYKVAAEHFIDGGVNRVMLATDGDFNVGVTQQDQLEALITGKAKDGVFLTVLGFGTGNIKDSTVEMLADKGNGHYAYIDSLDEGRRVLVDQLGATLQVIAKDVKIQVEFNPGHVGAWRLIGYANRLLAARDFNDDTKDAGEIGAGHSVVALYEIAPPGTSVIPGVDPLKYQKVLSEPAPELVDSPELMTLKLRWKLPDSDTSSKLELAVIDEETSLDEPSTELRFAAALAAFGMQLRESPYRGATSWDLIASLAASGRGDDPKGYRAEFARLVDTARAIAGQ